MVDDHQTILVSDIQSVTVSMCVIGNVWVLWEWVGVCKKVYIYD